MDTHEPSSQQCEEFLSSCSLRAGSPRGCHQVYRTRTTLWNKLRHRKRGYPLLRMQYWESLVGMRRSEALIELYKEGDSREILGNQNTALTLNTYQIHKIMSFVYSLFVL